MKLKFVFASVFALLSGFAKAETLVVAAPFTDYPALATQMLHGAKAAVTAEWTVKQVDASCSDDKAALLPNMLLAEKPDMVIGLPCIESLMLALQTLGPIGIPIITVASRAIGPSTLAAENQWRLFRLGPRENDETAAVATLIVNAWKTVPFAIVDDGTIFARDTAEAVRNETELMGINPVLVDQLQPQLESQKPLIDRLVAAGATHVFIAADRGTIAQITRQAAGLNITFAGPETLRASDLDFPLPQGVLMVARDVQIDEAAKSKIEAVLQTPFAFAEGYSRDAFVAAQIAMQLKADPSLTKFQTAFGAVTIAGDGFMEPNQFALFAFDGIEFEKVVP